MPVITSCACSFSPCTYTACITVIIIISLLTLCPDSTTLEIVQDAFCCFDASSDGYLEREEVEAALCSTRKPGRCGGFAAHAALPNPEHDRACAP